MKKSVLILRKSKMQAGQHNIMRFFSNLFLTHETPVYKTDICVAILAHVCVEQGKPRLLGSCPMAVYGEPSEHNLETAVVV